LEKFDRVEFSKCAQGFRDKDVAMVNGMGEPALVLSSI
jgi:hypothetical protein